MNERVFLWFVSFFLVSFTSVHNEDRMIVINVTLKT